MRFARFVVLVIASCPITAFAGDGPKKDVRGVYLGMPVADAQAELKKQGAICSPISPNPVSVCDFDPTAEQPTMMRLSRSSSDPARLIGIEYTFSGTYDLDKLVAMYQLRRDETDINTERPSKWSTEVYRPKIDPFAYITPDGTKMQLSPGKLTMFNAELAAGINGSNVRQPGPAKF